MNTNVGSDVIALDCSSSAGSPLALEIEVIRALATDMAFTDMFL